MMMEKSENKIKQTNKKDQAVHTSTSHWQVPVVRRIHHVVGQVDRVALQVGDRFIVHYHHDPPQQKQRPQAGDEDGRLVFGSPAPRKSPS